MATLDDDREMDDRDTNQSLGNEKHLTAFAPFRI